MLEEEMMMAAEQKIIIEKVINIVMAANISQSLKRAVAYSFLAHIRNNRTFANGPLDVFVPIVKNALSELYPNGAVQGASLSELTNAIEERFALDIPAPVMMNIMKKIAYDVNKESGLEDMQIFEDGAFIIQKYIFEAYKEQMQISKDEVAKVLALFRKFCKIYNNDINGDEVDLISFIEQNQVDISFYLAHEPKKDAVQSTIAAQFIELFRNAPQVYETLKSVYLGSMLTSYLHYQPKEVKMDVELLLDTNFIVSLLDLNTPESTKTCSTFMKVSKSLGYKFTVLKDTIEEFQALLSYKAEYLNQAIIAKSINKEDIYNACDRRKLTRVDLERIADKIEDTLTSKFNIYIVPNTEKLKGKARFSKEYETFKKIRSSEKSALHDAIAVQYVKEKRGNKQIYDFDKVNCWFVNNAISHYTEHNEGFCAVKNGKNVQPEIIKVDDLLNIIWLSNPSNGVENMDFVDMGIASMVSYTLNSTLPKARIIKELDENIQKYRDDQDITDKDVVRLSTRIVQRQIEDVQALNELAKKDGAEFAARVKDEALKQEQIDTARAQKMDQLIKTLQEGVDNIRQNKENLDRKNDEKIAELDAKEKDLQKKHTQLSLKEKELAESSINFEKEKEQLRQDNTEKDAKLKAAWKNKNKELQQAKQEYIDKAFEKEQRKRTRKLIYSVLFLVVVAIGIISAYIFNPTGTVVWLDMLMSHKMISGFGSGAIVVLEVLVIKDYDRWHNKPTTKKEFTESLDIPSELQQIEYNDFLARL